MKQELSDIVVTGEYAPISSKSAVYNVTTISKSELQAKGATNLREALDNKLGINLSQDNVFGSSASLNGISGEGIKILVNGVPMAGRIDGKIDLSQINMNNVERIEIVKGPLSVLYGSDALGGVINLITKNQKNTWNVFAKGFYESVGQYNVSVGGGANIKKGFISFDAGRNFFDGYSVKILHDIKNGDPKNNILRILNLDLRWII
jgi:outer membrane receptor for ferrienterochelin and colicins